MAVRERKGRASPWQCYWNNPLTGKRECANFATRQEAEKHDSLIKHRIKFERESFRMEGEEKKSSSELTLEACYLQYLKEKQFSKKSLQWQLTSMRYALRKFGQISVADITRGMLDKLKEEMLSQSSVKPVTVRDRLSVLRTVLRWCAEKGYRGPVEFPKMPTAHYEKFVPPTTEELTAIMEVASPHIVRVVILGAQFGVRVGQSELLQITWNDVDLSRGILRVHGSKKNANAPWREVPIRESLLPVFEAWKTQDENIGATHLVHYRGKPIQSIQTAWEKTLRRAGITRRIRPYDLRHAFGTEMVAAGVDVGTVAHLMGHSDPSMLLSHYQYVMDTQKKAAVESLPNLGHVPNGMCPKNEAATKVM